MTGKTGTHPRFLYATPLLPQAPELLLDAAQRGDAAQVTALLADNHVNITRFWAVVSARVEGYRMHTP